MSTIIDDVQDYDSVVDDTYNKAISRGLNRPNVGFVSVPLQRSSNLNP